MKRSATRSTHTRLLNFATIFVLLTVAAAALAVPFATVRSKVSSADREAKRIPESTARGSASTRNIIGWSAGIRLPAPLVETVTTFAADCTTPKVTFNLGETVCAQTDNVTETDRWLNWLSPPDTHVAFGGPTQTAITTNPQNFLYTPTVSGAWKASIADASDSSIVPAVFTVVAPNDTAAIYMADCVTPASSFNLGDTVCAKVTGAPLNSRPLRRLSIETPTALIAAQVFVTTDPQTLTFTLPTSASTTYGDTSVDNRGGWKVVNSSGIDGELKDSMLFYVHDPQTAVSDLVVTKTVAGSTQVSSGANVSYTIIVRNYGPDAAPTVELTDQSPANTTFVSASQDSGPAFSCNHPSAGGTGTSTCTRTSLAVGDIAEFTFVYKVDTGAAIGTTIPNTASVSSANTERFNVDNSSTVQVVVSATGGGGGGTCTLGCPDDITTPANTTQGSESGAIVHFSPPSGNEECGNITVDHCNDCFFPEGTTVVTATSETGDSCSFTVTITAAGSHPTISCPGNKTGNADSSCSATFNLGTATATGTNVTVVAFRSDGKPVYTCDAFGNCTRNGSDAPFSVGITTVTWFAYAHDVPGPYTGPVDQNGDPLNPADTEEAHRTGSATCTQTVTVNDVTPPTIAATNTTVPADASCQAAVPDFSNTVSDNCACSASDQSEDCQNHNDISYTQTPAAGTLLGPGTYTVHIEAGDGTNTATKDITLTVADQTPPQITCPANQTVNTDPGLCSATVNPGTATATDNCDSSPTIVGTRSDSQALNAPYPHGTTTITWKATDDAGNFSECTQTINVEDHENPTISCPANIVLEPTCPSGAIATYTAPVGQDNCPGAQTTRTAGGASGSVFPIGTTTVTHTVTDASGNTASCSFTVTVKTVLQTLADLRASVAANTQLSGPQRNGLLSKLDAAKQHIENGQQNGACAKLADFINSTGNFISNGSLSAATGNAWINTAKNIRNTLGCTSNPCT